jgi:hypothetical protein
MALQLNLLHEEISEHRQRQRDPLKIGMMLMGGLVAFLVAYYLWSAYRTLELKSRLGGVEREWSKVEPKVTAAQKRADELNNIIKTTKALDEYIDNRFYWAPFLEIVSRCVAPNAQLSAFEGNVSEDGKLISVTIDGVAAGREPRAAAEDFRQMLLEQLGRAYADVKVEFKALEDLDTIVTVSGGNMAMAHYGLTVNFSPAAPKPAATPTFTGREKKR